LRMFAAPSDFHMKGMEALYTSARLLYSTCFFFLSKP
jgi:hypothetical protein